MDKEPKEPMELKLLGIYGESHKDAEVAKHIDAHICKCQAFHGDLKLGGKRRQCPDSICYYFRWFYPYHHNQCNYACFKSSKKVSGCSFCSKLKNWIKLHSKDCITNCLIAPCHNIYKREQLKKRLTDPHMHSTFLNSSQSEQNNSAPSGYTPASTFPRSNRPQERPVHLYGRQAPTNQSLIENVQASASMTDIRSYAHKYNGSRHVPVQERKHYTTSTDSQPSCDQPNEMSLSARTDSLSSTFSLSAEPYRSDLSEGLIQAPAEYQSPEKVNPPFNVTTSFQRGSMDSTTSQQSFNASKQSLQRTSDTIHEFSSTDEESVPSGLNLPTSNPEDTLPVTSLPNRTGEHLPVQRQETTTEPKKIVFGGKAGRNSISLTLPTCAESTENFASLDTQVAHPRSPRSPRRSRVLTEKRKQQMKQQENVVSNSPDLSQRPSQSGHSRHQETKRDTFRTTSPEDDPVDDFSSLSSNEGTEPVFSDTEARKGLPKLPPKLSYSRDVYSPSSDSSPGPSSLEEERKRGRRHRVVQREDTDPGKGHSKILLGTGSITPRDYKDIQHFQALHSLVKFRHKTHSDPENGNRTSGVSSASLSNSSITSARSSSGSAVFSDCDSQYNSLEAKGDHENEDSASTIVGNSDHSINSEQQSIGYGQQCGRTPSPQINQPYSDRPTALSLPAHTDSDSSHQNSYPDHERVPFPDVHMNSPPGGQYYRPGEQEPYYTSVESQIAAQHTPGQHYYSTSSGPHDFSRGRTSIRSPAPPTSYELHTQHAGTKNTSSYSDREQEYFPVGAHMNYPGSYYARPYHHEEPCYSSRFNRIQSPPYQFNTVSAQGQSYYTTNAPQDLCGPQQHSVPSSQYSFYGLQPNTPPEYHGPDQQIRSAHPHYTHTPPYRPHGHNRPPQERGSHLLHKRSSASPHDQEQYYPGQAGFMPSYQASSPDSINSQSPSVPDISPYAIAQDSDSWSEGSSYSKSDSPSPPPTMESLPSCLMQDVDELLHQYQQDVHRMKHRPKRGGKIPTHDTPGMSEEEKEQMMYPPRRGHPISYTMDQDSDYFPVSPNYPSEDSETIAREQELYREMMSQQLPTTPQEEIVWKNMLARRDQLKEYLVDQFFSDQVYREHVDWERKIKLGHGAQASCFTVCDFRTKCILVMKEESENKKTLDEAFLSLKFACQSNPSPNIVEYYTAALLPGNLIVPPKVSPYVQIFMEHMPACLQGYLFKCGPIPLHNVHHYACQLFDALDFLHNKEGIIHCDIKPANILVDDTAQRIKLTDFGSAEILEEKRTDYMKRFSADRNAGTLSYNPPEFYRDYQCSFAFDIWQAGCCVLAMCTGRRPWRYLFMDVYPGKQPDQITKAMKKKYMVMIGEQTQGHLYPAFLDCTLQKLLYGCLHDNPSRRLTAKDCSYLLNTEIASSEEEKKKILEALGYTPSCPVVLQSFPTDQPCVDIYLGNDCQSEVPLGDSNDPRQIGGSVHLAMYGGWIGSVVCPEGTTYRQMEAEINRVFPVLEPIGRFFVASYTNHPHNIWTACSSNNQDSPYRPTNPDSLVDTNSAIVLSPLSASMV